MIESMHDSASDQPSGVPALHPTARVPVDVDREALTEWLLAGVNLFVCEGLPSRQAVDDAAQRVVMVAALRRAGSISGAALVLGTSRRALRDAMKRLGIYERWQARGAAAEAAAPAAGSSRDIGAHGRDG